ncbi:hypothetical protein [Streptomyces sp. NPDC095817]|uniref:hypothetical protein n=1 Tax=unclassified Streptomyces TaxID=2593676 RepID=UPI003325B7C4
MSTIPQTSRQGHPQAQQQDRQQGQQGPTTSPPQQFGPQQGMSSQQPYGTQPQQSYGQQEFGGRIQQPYGQQEFGQQIPQQYGGQMQQPYEQQDMARHDMGRQMPQQQIPPHLQQQLQQIGRQQPFEHLLQQLGGQQAQSPGLGQPLVLPSAVQAASLVTGIATKFWDVVTPLPGQPSILYLFIDDGWRQLVNPNQVTHDQVQEAFAFGQQVIGLYDTATNALQAVIVNKQ